MKKTMLLVMVVFLLMSSTVFANGNSLSDINNHWAEKNINRLNTVSIINGYPDGSFKPNNTMTRAEFIKVLVSSIGYETKDVTGKWYQKYLNSAIKEKIITNDLSSIDESPEQEITRLEAVLLFNNLIRKEIELDTTILEDPKFTDQKTTIPILTVYSYGVVEGYPDNSFRPNQKMTRSEVATIFSNMFFGKRNDKDHIIKLPLFDQYENQFEDLTKKRIESIKNDTPLHESLEEYQESTSGVEIIIPEDEVIEDENNSEVPQYLQERFDMIADEFNLTWTDEDFETWYKTSSDTEKEKYMSYEFNRPEFDFDKKIALISEPTHYKIGASKNILNLNQFNGEYLTDDLSFIAYEMYKRNIEMLIKDNEDWGKFKVTHVTVNNQTDVDFVVVDGEYEERESFKVSLLPKENNDSFRNYGYFFYSLADQLDYGKNTDWFEKWEDTVYDYVNDNTKMNMYFIHGKEVGNEIFSNYMDAYQQRMVVGLGSTPEKKLNITTKNIETEHHNESGWTIYIRKIK